MQRAKNTFLLIVTSKQKKLIALLVLLILSFNSFTQTASSIPHLEIRNNKTQLIVNDKPFLILGGELGNSAASSREYMEPIWPKLKEMNLNTVLMPVYWDLIEPEENKFDFSLVDDLITDASANNLHLVILWFGTWKNSMSCYVPAWIKKDYKRFPRTIDKNGKAQEIWLTQFLLASTFLKFLMIILWDGIVIKMIRCVMLLVPSLFKQARMNFGLAAVAL